MTDHKEEKSPADDRSESLLDGICSPEDLRDLSLKDLRQLAGEIREELCRLSSTRTAHFASNLGVVELTLALHSTFDFSHDRLIWDTGHQIYPHKLVTGRYGQFSTIRTKGGLMGYPNPEESDYDLFMTGHAGSSVSTMLGIRCGDDLIHADENRRAVAVVGDGAFPCGPIFEAMNHTGGLGKPLLVILNDNKMSICPRVGGLGRTLDRMRMTSFYTNLKMEVQRLLQKIPVIGDPTERFLSNIKNSLKAGLLGGMFFEDLGFHYIGPVDGHDIGQLRRNLEMVADADYPILLHVVTEKGHGFRPAVEDPTAFHAPAPFVHKENNIVEPMLTQKQISPAYTTIAREAILEAMEKDSRVVTITAAMCQGNKLEPVREKFPDRFFDVGICESHAVSFAAGLAKTGMRPIVTIYSTFMQRSYDQIFQELALQNLPVLLMLDRAGVVGPDGQTHHGTLDLTYLRPLPTLTVMAPGDAEDLENMVDFALQHDGPTAIRYPKTESRRIERPHDFAPIELGRAETFSTGTDLTLIACGEVLGTCLEAASLLKEESDIDVGVINARFVKPLDTNTILRAIQDSRIVVTVEEGQLMGGFGSAVLEAACDAQLSTHGIRRMGIGDRFVQHATRQEQLSELGLDAAGIVRSCNQWLEAPVV